MSFERGLLMRMRLHPRHKCIKSFRRVFVTFLGAVREGVTIEKMLGHVNSKTCFRGIFHDTIFLIFEHRSSFNCSMTHEGSGDFCSRAGILTLDFEQIHRLGPERMAIFSGPPTYLLILPFTTRPTDKDFEGGSDDKSTRQTKLRKKSIQKDTS